MSVPLILGCVWVLAAAAVAMLPMRAQYIPGLALLLAAPVLIVWIGATHGWLATGFAVFALVSMFRNPLRHMTRWLWVRLTQERA